MNKSLPFKGKKLLNCIAFTEPDEIILERFGEQNPSTPTQGMILGHLECLPDFDNRAGSASSSAE